MPAQALDNKDFWKPLEAPTSVKDTEALHDSIQYGTQKDYDTIADRAVEPLLKDLEQAFRDDPRSLKQFQTYAQSFRDSIQKFKDEEQDTFTNDPSTWKKYIDVFRKDLVEARDMAKDMPDTLSLRRACDACQLGAGHFVASRLENEQRSLKYRKNVSEAIDRAKEFEKLAGERPWIKENLIFQRNIQHLNDAAKKAAIDVANIYNSTHPEEDLHPGISQEFMKEADRRLKELNRATRATETTIRILIGRHAAWKDESWEDVQADALYAQESVNFAKTKAERISSAIQKLAEGIKKPLRQAVAVLKGVKGAPDKEAMLQKAQGAGLSLAQSTTILGKEGFNKMADAMGKRIENSASKRKFIEAAKSR